MSYPIKGGLHRRTNPRRAAPESSGGCKKILGCDRHPFLVGLYVFVLQCMLSFKRPMRARLVQGYRHPRSTWREFPTRSANGFSANFSDRRGQS